MLCFLDQHILIGTDEGIYTFNLNEIHENTMELVSFGSIEQFDLFNFYKHKYFYRHE